MGMYLAFGVFTVASLAAIWIAMDWKARIDAYDSDTMRIMLDLIANK